MKKASTPVENTHIMALTSSSLALAEWAEPPEAFSQAASCVLQLYDSCSKFFIIDFLLQLVDCARVRGKVLDGYSGAFKSSYESPELCDVIIHDDFCQRTLFSELDFWVLWSALRRALPTFLLNAFIERIVLRFNDPQTPERRLNIE